ncbi:hypothetical protein BpHYR1_002629 [Brachionus plicatilis]|uniref:Uncharacterized protein n=1 Tax=Brachionus plicatilis TaxID=10195 RepID=A0A3M7PKZ3_BRAPC|nr:hypothetical protein BpHYR1_002629 [Brachionus plicatilis]
MNNGYVALVATVFDQCVLKLVQSQVYQVELFLEQITIEDDIGHFPASRLENEMDLMYKAISDQNCQLDVILIVPLINNLEQLHKCRIGNKLDNMMPKN